MIAVMSGGAILGEMINLTIFACRSKALHLARSLRLFLRAIRIWVLPRTEAWRTERGLGCGAESVGRYAGRSTLH